MQFICFIAMYLQATDAFTRYLNTYMKRDILEEGYLSVAVKYIASGQAESGVHFVLQALDVDPTNEHALTLLKEHGDKKSYKNALSKAKAASHHVATTDPSNDPTDMSNRRKSDGAVKQSFNSEWKTVIKNEPNNAKVRLFPLFSLSKGVRQLHGYALSVGTFRTSCPTFCRS